MKKFYFFFLFVFSFVNSQAQYKKASFLTKSGRTYDLAFTSHLLPGDRSMVPGIAYSYGKDNGKRVFHWFDLELLLPAKFAYNTTGLYNQLPIAVTGKSKTGLAYRYNLGVFLTDIKKAVKFRPFVNFGLNILILGGTAKASDVKYTPDTDQPLEILSTSGVSGGLNAGAGIIYQFTSLIGIKLTGGYNYQRQFSTESLNGITDADIFEVFPSHPYFSVGIHFSLHDD